MDVLHVLKRLPEPSTRYLFNFLTREDSLIKAGDKYTIKLREEWNWKGWDHSMTGLTDREALDLVIWISVH
jgi:hypothetical protein